MQVLHVSAECYPAAKAGGLGDVVGALPKYLNQIGKSAAVILPKYGTKWIKSKSFRYNYEGKIRLGPSMISFQIHEYEEMDLGFPLFVVDIPGFFDREGVYTDTRTGYGYSDEVERYLLFQQAVLQWVQQFEILPEVLHCHDHHTGLIPFMVKHCPEFTSLRHLPTVFTIHNGVYHGAFSWQKQALLPWYDAYAGGLLDWGNTINPLATAVKCAWRVTTVSPSYMDELKYKSNGLEPLFNNEWRKCEGILNGIDSQVWNPATDPMLAYNLGEEGVERYKHENKQVLCQRFHIQPELPLATFIGRLVGEKGADILPEVIRRFLQDGHRMSFVLLGTGEQDVMNDIQQLKYQFPGLVDVALEYNETLSHQLYAGSDFLMMPSRVEPCGLNQLYALRYGTAPIVRSVGGLKDTVRDIGEEGGVGVRFDNFTNDDVYVALYRAKELYWNADTMYYLRRRMMQIDHSWEVSATRYKQIYDIVCNL
jgi:starch synthase